MDHQSLADRLVKVIERLPSQLQTAARYVLEHPRDVALLSMREQARRAGVPPATMTRLAKRLGLEGYDAVRGFHADAVRQGPLGFAGRAGAQVKVQKLKGDETLAAEMVAVVAAQVARLAEPATLDALSGAAHCLHKARRVFCLGLRSSYVVAWHVQYVFSLLGEQAIMLDDVAGIGVDPIRRATRDDVLLAVSVRPYTRATVEIARYAVECGLTLVAITDSRASPLVPLAKHVLLATTESPSFLHSMTPAFALAEVLVALATGLGGAAVPRALRSAEQQLAAFDAHWAPRSQRVRKRKPRPNSDFT